MPLPEQTILSTQIKDFITSNKSADPDKAVQDFADFLAGLILDTIKQGDIQGVTTTVIGSSATGGPVTGTGSQNNIVKMS